MPYFAVASSVRRACRGRFSRRNRNPSLQHIRENDGLMGLFVDFVYRFPSDTASQTAVDSSNNACTRHRTPGFEQYRSIHRVLAEAVMKNLLAVGLVVIMVCSVFAPSVAATDTTQAESIQEGAIADSPVESRQTQTPNRAQSPTATASLQEIDEVPYDELSDELQALASVTPETDVDVNETLSQEQRDAARSGTRAQAQPLPRSRASTSPRRRSARPSTVRSVRPRRQHSSRTYPSSRSKPPRRARPTAR